MTQLRFARPIRTAMLALSLALFATTARAQEPAPVDGEAESPGSGPVPGYVASGMLAGLVIFVLCKSARR